MVCGMHCPHNIICARIVHTHRSVKSLPTLYISGDTQGSLRSIGRLCKDQPRLKIYTFERGCQALSNVCITLDKIEQQIRLGLCLSCPLSATSNNIQL